jgi:transcription factor WhiB
VISNNQQDNPLEWGWRARAACREIDNPELFFPTAESGPARTAQVAAAKAVCARCPVRQACLDEALRRIPYGICGGVDRARAAHVAPHSTGPGGDVGVV